MSQEFRRSILNRLPPMPPTRAPWADEPEDENDDYDDDDEQEELADGLGDLGGKRLSRHGGPFYTPLPASDFFEQALEITPEGNDATFRAYINLSVPPDSSAPSAGGSRGPGLRTAPSKNPHGTYIVAHHGAGATALSFANLALEIKARSKRELGFLAYDARGHGKTRVDGKPGRGRDLSLPTLLTDLLGVIEHTFPDPKQAPSLLLIGHSMGAAPIADAAPLLQKKGYTVCGVVVLDVVEGTAIESLPLMKSILAQRPTTFPSLSDAIQWHIQSGSSRNPTSASVAVPSYVMPAPGSNDPDGKQVWRTDLLSTEPYWTGWYEGLSARFLACRCARMLVLAGQERLDRELMVGQMQGKFQLEVLQDVGHYLHEDEPATLAALLIAFWRRNTQVLVLPPKIGSKPVEVRQVGQV